VERLSNLEGWADYLYSFYFSMGVFTGFSNEVSYRTQSTKTWFIIIVQPLVILGVLAASLNEEWNLP